MASVASTIESFSGNMKEFVTYLIDNQGLSSTLYLFDVQAGSEPFTGTSKLTVSDYSVAIM
ncbi:hypothetical protein PENDEC_c008G00912 [Penicillium decumbens]|uniref:xyloglucan-specific endo-beta-1,4-glucanase n=1 Tax=Penicillium decumbens TaxID=69771 RepID=A0A1V6PEI7_PENDC|nr:hypothetical protein PENDEC_c008G00912 [Penicillium decumbens]